MAGLLDFIGSQGGGLLDFLRQNAMNQQFSSGLPSDQAQYGSPIQPQTQAMAQMPQDTPQQAPAPVAPQPTPQSPGVGGFLQGLNENFQTMGNGGSLIGALTGQQPNNQTAQFLVSKGIDPSIAKSITSDPVMLRAVLPHVMGIGGQTEDIKEFERAQKDPAFAKYLESKRSGAGEVGLNPVWGEDGKGNPVLGQLNKRGEFIQTKLPAGVVPSKGVDKVDMGTEWGVISKVNGQLIGKYPKNVVEKEAQEKEGQARGAARVALPAAESTTTRALNMLKQAEEHPGLGDSVGFVVGRLPALTPKGADFRERIEQIDAMVFGDAVEVMRGLGALTDKEGPKVTAARARLKTAKSEEDFRTALKDVREVFETGIANMRQKAGGGSAPATAPKRIRINADGTIAQ